MAFCNLVPDHAGMGRVGKEEWRGMREVRFSLLLRAKFDDLVPLGVGLRVHCVLRVMRLSGL